jgi:hypothetical protein
LGFELVWTRFLKQILDLIFFSLCYIIIIFNMFLVHLVTVKNPFQEVGMVRGVGGGWEGGGRGVGGGHL